MALQLPKRSVNFLELLRILNKAQLKRPAEIIPITYLPAIASSILRRAPSVVIPKSFRSWSVNVKNVCISI